MRYLCLLVVLTPLVLMAADPVGKITSSGPLTLDGKAVPVTATSSLPLVAGDEIATAGSAATIFFADRSRATIAPNSRLRLEPNGSSVALRVLSGSVNLKRAQSSRVTVIAPILPAASKSTVTGSTAAGQNEKCPDKDWDRDRDRDCDKDSSDRDHKPPSRSERCPPDKHWDKDCDKEHAH